MQYNLSTVMVDSEGSPAFENGKPVTVKLALSRALLAEVSGTGGQLTPDAKLKRYALFMRVHGAGDTIELSVDDASLAKEAASVFPTLTYGQLAQFLDTGTV